MPGWDPPYLACSDCGCSQRWSLPWYLGLDYSGTLCQDCGPKLRAPCRIEWVNTLYPQQEFCSKFACRRQFVQETSPERGPPHVQCRTHSLNICNRHFSPNDMKQHHQRLHGGRPMTWTIYRIGTTGNPDFEAHQASTTPLTAATSSSSSHAPTTYRESRVAAGNPLNSYSLDSLFAYDNPNF